MTEQQHCRDNWIDRRATTARLVHRRDQAAHWPANAPVNHVAINDRPLPVDAKQPQIVFDHEGMNRFELRVCQVAEVRERDDHSVQVRTGVTFQLRVAGSELVDRRVVPDCR